MEVQIFLPAKTPKKAFKILEAEYPDIEQDGDEEHDDLSYFVGRSNDDPLKDDNRQIIEWLTYNEAVELCGFVEGAIPGSETLIEGNGAWAQGMISRRDFSSLAISQQEKASYKKISNRFWKAFDRGKKSRLLAVKG